MRVAASLVAACLVLALTSCAPAASPHPRAQVQRKPAPASAETQTKLRAGDHVTMRNGLTLTIPVGWQGDWSSFTAKDSSDGSIESVRLFGGPAESAKLPVWIALESGADTSTAQWGGTLKRIASAPHITASWIVAKGQPSGTHVVVVELAAAGAQPGVVMMGQFKGDAMPTIRRVWDAFHIQGVSLPASWR